MAGVNVLGRAAYDHSSLLAFGGSDHPDREDGEKRRPHLIQLHSRDRLLRYLGIVPVFQLKSNHFTMTYEEMEFVS